MRHWVDAFVSISAQANEVDREKHILAGHSSKQANLQFCIVNRQFTILQAVEIPGMHVKILFGFPYRQSESVRFHHKSSSHEIAARPARSKSPFPLLG